jgi:hypothetical protein
MKDNFNYDDLTWKEKGELLLEVGIIKFEEIVRKSEREINRIIKDELLQNRKKRCKEGKGLFGRFFG